MEVIQSPEVPAELREFCSAIGSDARLVQGAGGNISWKESKTRLTISASGATLSSATHEDIFVGLDLGSQELDFSRPSPFETEAVLRKFERRPSIEWSLHARIPARYVLHLHPVDVLALMVRRSWTSLPSPDAVADKKVAFIPYAKPGWHLAQAIHPTSFEGNTEVVLFLKNHGLVVAAESLDKLEQTLHSAMEAVKVEVRTPVTRPKTLMSLPPGWNQAPDPVNTLAQDEEILKSLEKVWGLYPDHVVFLGPRPWICDQNDVEPLTRTLSPAVTPLFVREAGVLIPKNFSRARMEMLICFYEVLSRQEALDMLQPLTPFQVEELVNWEAERHRIELSEQPGLHD